MVVVCCLSTVGVARGQQSEPDRQVAKTRAAAEAGSAEAQTMLGAMYDFGEVVRQDDQEAVKWYRRAADQGYSYAQHYLGTMYADGRGVRKDTVAAYMWHELAVMSALNADDRRDFATARDRVGREMKPEQIAEGKRRAQEWQIAFKKKVIVPGGERVSRRMATDVRR